MKLSYATAALSVTVAWTVSMTGCQKPLAAQATVHCELARNSVGCTVERTAGSAQGDACWEVAADCDGHRSTARLCNKIPAPVGASAKRSVALVDEATGQSCHALSGLAVSAVQVQ